MDTAGTRLRSYRSPSITFDRVIELFEKYADLPADFADADLLAISGDRESSCPSSRLIPIFKCTEISGGRCSRISSNRGHRSGDIILLGVGIAIGMGSRFRVR